MDGYYRHPRALTIMNSRAARYPSFDKPTGLCRYQDRGQRLSSLRIVGDPTPSAATSSLPLVSLPRPSTATALATHLLSPGRCFGFQVEGLPEPLDRTNGELLVAEKYDPTVNWAAKIDMDKNSTTNGRPLVVPQYSTEHQGPDVNTKGICPSSIGTKNQQPAAFSPDTGLFYVPTTHLCMDYEPFRVSYTAGQPYVGVTLSMYPPPGKDKSGNFIAWDSKPGKIVWSTPERFAIWSGALATAGGVVFYGTLEGYLKAGGLGWYRP